MKRSASIFVLIWLGQVVSLFGTGLTRFALAVWVYQKTGQATQYALILFFSALPEIAFSPIAGALVDRWDRRWALILSDSGSALATLALAVLLLAHRLEVWHIYVAMVLSAVFGSFQWPAYSASMTLLIPRRHLGRANGLDELGRAVSQIVAPLAGVSLIAAIGIHGVLLVDFGTFLFALATLTAVRIPRPDAVAAGRSEPGGHVSLLREARQGWSYIMERRGLVHLLCYLGLVNMAVGFNMALTPPLVLSFSSAAGLGTVMSTASVGLLVGGLLMGVWGGPRRKVHAILGFGFWYGVALVVLGLRASVTQIAVASFMALFSVPLINGCSQVIWQSRVPPELQGRVFAVRRMIAQATLPLAYATAGPVADRVFEPLLAVHGPLADSMGPLLGAGPGRGIGLLYLVLGSLTTAATIAGYLAPRLRGLEEELPEVTSPRAG